MSNKIRNITKRLSMLTGFIQWGVVIILVLISAALVLSKFDTPIKLKIYTVMSGSMKPEINTGSIVFVLPQKEYFNDDVITFRLGKDPNKTTTHRIINLYTDKASSITTFYTKGDANKDIDPFTINTSQIVGKVFFALPLIGYLVNFTQTQLGFIILIIVPATILIYSEILSIKEQLVAGIESRRSISSLSNFTEQNLKRNNRSSGKNKFKFRKKYPGKITTLIPS